MEWLLFLHLLGVVLLLGNIITAAFWKVRADRTGNPEIIHNAAKNVMLADCVFTLPGLLLVIATGGVMAERAGYRVAEFNWLTLSLILFAVTGILWLAVLLPLQRKMIRHSAKAAEGGNASAAYRRASSLWAAAGTAATLLPVVILYLMIGKNF
jgi:uncharacterized membrane protein